MAEKDDLLYNIVIPSSVIAVLFLVNALVFLAIMRCRQRYVNEMITRTFFFFKSSIKKRIFFFVRYRKRGLEFDPHELAQL